MTSQPRDRSEGLTALQLAPLKPSKTFSVHSSQEGYSHSVRFFLRRGVLAQRSQQNLAIRVDAWRTPGWKKPVRWTLRREELMGHRTGEQWQVVPQGALRVMRGGVDSLQAYRVPSQVAVTVRFGRPARLVRPNSSISGHEHALTLSVSPSRSHQASRDAPLPARTHR